MSSPAKSACVLPTSLRLYDTQKRGLASVCHCQYALLAWRDHYESSFLAYSFPPKPCKPAATCSTPPGGGFHLFIKKHGIDFTVPLTSYIKSYHSIQLAESLFILSGRFGRQNHNHAPSLKARNAFNRC